MFVRVKTQESVSQLIKECSRLHGDGCARMDVTGAQVTVDPGMLEAVVRDNLNITARRDVVVTQPLKVTEVGRQEYTISPFHIERSNCKEKMESGSGYLRLCPGQAVGLCYAGLVLELEDVVKKGGIVTEIKVNVGVGG